MQKKVLFLLFDNLLVVLAYYFAAHLSVSFLSAPPSYASAIWPPSGISLAAVLLKGYRILPAIFIADLIIAIELVGFADFIGITFSLMVGFQAMITAWIGASLINRFLGANNPLIDNKSIGLFFLLGGPVSMVLPSAFALGVEYWLGMIKGSEFLLGVVTWWLGGSIGTIIFAPITLIIFGGGAQRTRIASIVIPLSVVFSILVWLFSYIKEHEQTRLDDIFYVQSQILHKETVNTIENLRHELQETRVFVELTGSINQQKFAEFSQYVLTHNLDNKALAWVSRVTDETKNQIESSIGKSIFKQKNGKSFEVGLKKEYFVIKFIEPLGRYQTLIGMDFVSRQMIVKALGDSEMGADAELLIVKKVYLEGVAQKLTVLIMPVFKHSELGGDNVLKGYVALMLPFHSVLNNAIKQAEKQKINLNIVGVGGSTFKAGDPLEKNNEEVQFVKTIKHFGYELKFKYFPSDDFVLSHGILTINWVFMLGLGVTGLLGFTLLSITGQTAQTKKIVEKKTKELYSKQQLLRTVLDSIKEGIVACDERGNLIVFNDAAEKICKKNLLERGHESRERGYTINDLQGIALLEKGESALAKLLTIREIRDFEFSLISGNNANKILKVNSTQILNESGQVEGFVASFQNITRQKQTLDELKKLSWAVEYSPASILITDRNGNIEYVNSKFVEMTGYSAQEVMAKNPSFLGCGQTDKQKYNELWQALLSGQEWQGEFLNKKKNGHYYWSKQLIAPIVNEQEKITHFVAIQQDITEEKKIEKILSHQASHDALTGLLNRRECEKRLDRIIQTAQIQKSKHVFCFLDLDEFKVVNDSCGHKAGDYLLLEVCDLFKLNLRQRDSLIRLGGDEFGILMEHCSLDQAFPLANKICQSLAEYEFIWEERQFKIGVSIGLAEINEHTCSYTEIVSQADDACYTAKKAGRGRVSVY